MSIFNCNSKFNCTVAAIVASTIIGVLAAFFQITAAITVSTAFVWVAFGISVGYLAVLVAAAALKNGGNSCICSALNILLTGILGSILITLILLAFGIVATSVLSAILVGLLLFFFALTFTGSACYVRCLFDCGT
ncbi:MAG: hypothetical protein J6C98_04770 [Oscillospiraceae bacterium]|nr:hypothetical protein [Oscillospiraceae bacterium]